MGPNMHDLRDSYKATIMRILGNFQLLEFALKVYIGKTYLLIKNCVGDKVHFGYTAKDVESFALERLLNVFSKLNSNNELLTRLKNLKDERNHIAHKALIITMGAKYDQGAVEDKYIEYFTLEDELAECLKLVIEEVRSLKEWPK